jgi:hypothetical protein
MVMTVTALAVASMLGFFAGLWSFKVKSRWCPRCGGMTYPPSTSNTAQAA